FPVRGAQDCSGDRRLRRAAATGATPALGFSWLIGASFLIGVGFQWRTRQPKVTEDQGFCFSARRNATTVGLK
ncbi:hypothetical protein U1Q18_050495, partial [Sarracenia purpurea var. burkii]